MGHIHSIYDTDPHFSIDPITRVITNMSETKTSIVQNDHNSERFTFECPRFVDGHDMSTCNQVQVHYMVVDPATRDKHYGVYEMDDLQLSPEDENVVICSWLLSENVTRYESPLSFVIRMVCRTGTTIDYAWHTAINTDINIVAGIDGGEPIIMEYADIMEAWKQELAALQITDLLQTKASEESGGENVWTATFGNGRTVAFVVRNGKRGAAGAPSFDAEIVDDVLVIKDSGQGGAECLLLKDNETGKAHKLYMANGRLYVAESEV